jgi:hypothetical protein
MQPVSEMSQRVFKRRIASQWMGFPKSWNVAAAKPPFPKCHGGIAGFREVASFSNSLNDFSETRMGFWWPAVEQITETA